LNKDRIQKTNSKSHEFLRDVFYFIFLGNFLFPLTQVSNKTLKRMSNAQYLHKNRLTCSNIHYKIIQKHTAIWLSSIKYNNNIKYCMKTVQ